MSSICVTHQALEAGRIRLRLWECPHRALTNANQRAAGRGCCAISATDADAGAGLTPSGRKAGARARVVQAVEARVHIPLRRLSRPSRGNEGVFLGGQLRPIGEYADSVAHRSQGIKAQLIGSLVAAVYPFHHADLAFTERCR
ncbi:MAG: hypothetical protein [Inoviridae sp.]|nr:MAG: hypothetical protein [Inoviridae sp.]